MQKMRRGDFVFLNTKDRKNMIGLTKCIMLREDQDDKLAWYASVIAKEVIDVKCSHIRRIPKSYILDNDGRTVATNGVKEGTFLALNRKFLERVGHDWECALGKVRKNRNEKIEIEMYWFVKNRFTHSFTRTTTIEYSNPEATL